MSELLNRRRVVLGGLILGASGGALALGISSYAQEGRVLMSPDELQAELQAGRVVLVDVRRPDEWARTGVAEGALPIDMRDSAFIDRVRAVAEENPGLPIAFICAGGVRSRRVVRQMESVGLSNTIDIPEGMLGSSAGPGWLARGLPVAAVDG